MIKILKNKNDIEYIQKNFKNAKEFIDNNNNIINNIDKFITLFKKNFKIDKIEQGFILSCFLEYNYFQEEIKNKLTKKNFEKIIVKKVEQTLKDLTYYSDIIKESILLSNIDIDNEKRIHQNFLIIKKIVQQQKDVNNYYYLFDNLNYFKNDINRIKTYASFIDIILTNYIETKSYYID